MYGMKVTCMLLCSHLKQDSTGCVCVWGGGCWSNLAEGGGGL